jgi:hypothetical protein
MVTEALTNLVDDDNLPNYEPGPGVGNLPANHGGMSDPRPGPVESLPPFRSGDLTPRNTPSRHRPANQKLGAFNLNWNVPRGQSNPDGIAATRKTHIES